jgi:hypothetical protein
MGNRNHSRSGKYQISWITCTTRINWKTHAMIWSCAMHNCVAKLFSASLRYASITSYASLLQRNRGLFGRNRLKITITISSSGFCCLQSKAACGLARF